MLPSKERSISLVIVCIAVRVDSQFGTFDIFVDMTSSDNRFHIPAFPPRHDLGHFQDRGISQRRPAFAPDRLDGMHGASKDTFR